MSASLATGRADGSLYARHRAGLAFGYMPDQRGLYPKMRVRDQLAYLARLHGLTTGHAAGACDRWLRRLGIGVNACERVEALSHGNQQRVQLAAALVHDPRVLVLDEPFSGLDPLGIEAMAGVLRELAHAWATVVFSSHQLDPVEGLCEQVAIIDRGRVVLEGAVRAPKECGSRSWSWRSRGPVRTGAPGCLPRRRSTLIRAESG